jgi:creatinine amidohydrolase/Fe(II)-dependent formamide hydrolase-like protein
MLINAHGGNREIIGYTAQMAERRYGATIIVPGRHELVAGSVEAVRESMRKMDVHSGKNETGMALALFPELVEMARVRGFTPTSKWYEGVRHLADPEHPDILLAAQIAGAYRGDTHQFTTSGIYGFTDPNEADAEESRRQFDATVETYARLIELWRTVPERA